VSDEEAHELQRLLEAALSYAEACDNVDHPAMSPRAQDLHSAARRYRWAKLGVQPSERIRKKHRRG